jgi:hypothetical protein
MKHNGYNKVILNPLSDNNHINWSKGDNGGKATKMYRSREDVCSCNKRDA